MGRRQTLLGTMSANYKRKMTNRSINEIYKFISGSESGYAADQKRAKGGSSSSSSSRGRTPVVHCCNYDENGRKDYRNGWDENGEKVRRIKRREGESDREYYLRAHEAPQPRKKRE